MSEEAETLQELIQQGHELLKDLRLVERNVKEMLDQIPAKVQGEFDSLMAEAVDRGMEHYFAQIEKAVKDGQDGVMKRFDSLYNMLTHGTTQGPKFGHASELEQQIEAVSKIVQGRGF